MEEGLVSVLEHHSLCETFCLSIKNRHRDAARNSEETTDKWNKKKSLQSTGKVFFKPTVVLIYTWTDLQLSACSQLTWPKAAVLSLALPVSVWAACQLPRAI